jgi:hypothetical protein
VGIISIAHLRERRNFYTIFLSVSQIVMTGKSLEKRTMANANPAQRPAMRDNSTHDGV